MLQSPCTVCSASKLCAARMTGDRTPSEASSSVRALTFLALLCFTLLHLPSEDCAPFEGSGLDSAYLEMVLQMVHDFKHYHYYFSPGSAQFRSCPHLGVLPSAPEEPWGLDSEVANLCIHNSTKEHLTYHISCRQDTLALQCHTVARLCCACHRYSIVHSMSLYCVASCQCTQAVRHLRYLPESGGWARGAQGRGRGWGCGPSP